MVYMVTSEPPYWEIAGHAADGGTDYLCVSTLSINYISTSTVQTLQFTYLY